MRFIATLSLIVLLQTAFAETINTGRSNVELKIPTSYEEGSPLPLVVLLHGYTSSGTGQDEYMKFSELVDEYQFLLLMPDGTTEKSGQKNRFWNATHACCNMQNSDVDDSAYLISLINEVKARYSVDANRVFLIGHSNGGFMSHRMAYDHPDTIAAIASLAGASPANLEGAAPSRPVNILQIHGTADATVKYEGGQLREVNYPSADETMEKWAIYNAGISEKRLTSSTLDLDSGLEGEETTVIQFEPKGNIILWAIQEGGHVPKLSATFNRQVIEWLFDHPKTSI